MHESEITESNLLYASMWKVLAGDRPGADLVDRPGLAVCWADNPFPFWNAVFLTEETADPTLLRRRVLDAAGHMRAKRHDGLVYICEDYLHGEARTALPAIIEEAELDFALRVTGMAGSILPVEARPHPALRLVRAASDAVLRDYADINSEGYGFPLEAGRAGLEGSRLWKEEAFAYVGYVGDEPVSTSAAIVHRGMIYLALVATRPAAQRNGYAEATVRHALSQAHAATGLRRTILHASDAGAPVYRRVGYHPTAIFLTYKPRRAETATRESAPQNRA
jgi:GNAT superfamily N-acetyltransferase